MVDALDLGSSTERRVGSSPTIRTTMANPEGSSPSLNPGVEVRGKSLMTGWSDCPSVHK